MNKKEAAYYRAYEDCKSKMDLIIVPKYKWSKEYELMGSDHFSIIIEVEKEVVIKQQQRWSIGRADWMQFQKESTITTKMQDQNTIEEAYRCLNKTILQAAEKKYP